MALYPGAVQKPVTAHGGAIGPILGCVIHVTAGEGDPYNEFANPNNQVSSHFGIGNGQGGMADGLVEQYVDTGFSSWAQVAGNANYLSVETEGEPGDPLTPAQVQSFGQLLAWMYRTHGVPVVQTDTVGARGFITHGDGGTAWGGHFGCPGNLRASQRQAIIAVAIDLLFQPTPTPTQPTQEQMMTGSYGPNGEYTVSAAQAGTNHLLVFTLSPGQPWSVIDVTDAIQAAHPGQTYLVQP